MSSWITLNVVCSEPEALADRLKPAVEARIKNEKLRKFSTAFPDDEEVYEYATGVDLVVSTFTSRAGDPGTVLDRYVSACVEAAAEADINVELIVGVTANDTSDMGTMRVYVSELKWGTAERYSGELGGWLDGPATLSEIEVQGHSIEHLEPSANEQIGDKYGVWPAIGGNYS